MVQVSAHRGGSEDVRSATYDAYRRAPTTGAEYVEFDIRKTMDNVLVVYHDAHAKESGRLVANLQYRELCSQVGYEVPRVDEVMRLVAGRMIGHLDLKETGYEEEVVTLADSILGAGNFVATTLEDASVESIKRTFPQVTTALSLGRDLRTVPRRQWAGIRVSELSPLSRVRACGADWVAVNYKLARLGVIDLCDRHGIGIMLWTVDEDALIEKSLLDNRINVLITNRPRYAVMRRSVQRTLLAESASIKVPEALS